MGRCILRCTNNGRRTEANRANPRTPNFDGHIVELVEQNGDHAATQFTWDIFMLCGPLERAAQYGNNGKHNQETSPLSCPDNLAFRQDGTLIIATDGQIKTVNANDGMYFVPTTGEQRGIARQFFSGVPGGEVCGPAFTP